MRFRSLMRCTWLGRRGPTFAAGPKVAPSWPQLSPWTPRDRRGRRPSATAGSPEMSTQLLRRQRRLGTPMATVTTPNDQVGGSRPCGDRWQRSQLTERQTRSPNRCTRRPLMPNLRTQTGHRGRRRRPIPPSRQCEQDAAAPVMEASQSSVMLHAALGYYLCRVLGRGSASTSYSGRRSASSSGWVRCQPLDVSGRRDTTPTNSSPRCYACLRDRAS